MNIKYLKIIIPTWTLALVAFVYFSPTQLKVIPMLTVLFMAAGVNYALYKYLKATPSEQANIAQISLLERFKKKSKVAKPLRLAGLLLFATQVAVWLELIHFSNASFIGICALIVLLAYTALAIRFYTKEIKGPTL
ncbi:hypothetical protein [Mongoliitalea lutea]|uniref:Uncharacterized protein n=1 Tax=Mongoliitalea lutea TaxID=849756 RepID=A0A8J3CZ88_9BACT|nr:hypothetical protein [Mongoliitalea lutea]GHB45480.1 hypothetical protein GCM10008106_28100 [Mongoliitalea lutea]